MAGHFLLSARARTLSLGNVMRMTDKEAEGAFACIRWADTNGKPVCVHCACPIIYEARRPSGGAHSPYRSVCCAAPRSPGRIAVHERALFDYLTFESSPAFPGDSLIAVEITRTFEGKPVVTPRAFGFEDDRAIAA